MDFNFKVVDIKRAFAFFNSNIDFEVFFYCYSFIWTILGTGGSRNFFAGDGRGARKPKISPKI